MILIKGLRDLPPSTLTFTLSYPALQAAAAFYPQTQQPTDCDFN